MKDDAAAQSNRLTPQMMAPNAERDFEHLLEFLRQARGFDFRGYKRPSLMRRVSKRAQEVNAATFTDYLDYLQVHSEEFPQLFNTILINVTEFMRDEPAWEYLRQIIIPKIAERGGAIRVWSAGCASGEEAYTVAILLAEVLGRQEFVERVKIYATDIDEEALAKARNGYSIQELQPLGRDLIARYFDSHGGLYNLKQHLRRALIFGRHDVLQDAPISRLDLLLCRNLLMYFTAESQARVLARFHYGLKEDGYLFLGRAEMLLAHPNLFTPVDLKHRVFRKVPLSPAREVLEALASPGEGAAEESMDPRLRDLALEVAPMPQLLIDARGALQAANQAARRRLSIDPGEIGRQLRDLHVSHHPAELNPSLERVLREGTGVNLGHVRHDLDAETRYDYEVTITPLLHGDSVVGASVAFADVSGALQLRRELEESKHEIETAYEELQSSSEELETTNEELQSTVEELETTNEEMQSSNEELETMNEELESTNAELQTVNSDLRLRTDEVDRLNAFLESIIATVRAGMIALDDHDRVLMWNTHAEDLWGLRAGEVTGQDFFALDIGLPVQRLRAGIDNVRQGKQPSWTTELEATDRRGRALVCRVTVSALPSAEPGPSIVMVMDELTRRP